MTSWCSGASRSIHTCRCHKSPWDSAIAEFEWVWLYRQPPLCTGMSSDRVDGTFGIVHWLRQHWQPAHASAREEVVLSSSCTEGFESTEYALTRLVPCICELPLPRMLIVSDRGRQRNKKGGRCTKPTCNGVQKAAILKSLLRSVLKCATLFGESLDGNTVSYHLL